MTDSSNRVFDAVRRAVSSSGRSVREPVPCPPVLDETIIRQVRHEGDLARLFVDRAEAAGATVVRVSESGLAGSVAQALAPCDPNCVLYHRDVIQQWPALGEVLSRALPDSGTDDDRLFEAQAGVTSAEWGIAETGSIVCRSGSDRSRLASLVPPLHLAILDTRRLLPDLCDLFSVVGPEWVSSCVSLITGPSKTADLEGVLVTGMHGPGRLHVVLVDSGSVS
jgi:L-lactate utilization protein LutC